LNKYQATHGLEVEQETWSSPPIPHRGGTNMNSKPIVRTALAGAVLSLGAVGISATGALGAATNIPAASLGPISPGGPLPPPGTPGVNVRGNCPSFMYTDAPTFVFSSGSAVLYGPSSNPNTYGGNVEGTATLTWSPDGGTTIDGSYVGHAHLWFGQNINNNGQSYFGNTTSYNGSGPLGSFSVQVSGGDTTSASGHQSGWGHVNISCS